MKSPVFVLVFLPLFQAPGVDRLHLGAVSELELKKQPEKENFLVPNQLSTKDYDQNHYGGGKRIGSEKVKVMKDYFRKVEIEPPSEKTSSKSIGNIRLYEVKLADSEMGYLAMENKDIPKEVEDVMRESVSIIHPNKSSSLEADEGITRTLRLNREEMEDLERLTSLSLIHYIPRYVVEGPKGYFKLFRISDQDCIRRINAEAHQESYALLVRLCEMKLKELSGKAEKSEVESSVAKEAALCIKTLYVLSQTAYHGEATRTMERILNVMHEKPGKPFILDSLEKAYKLMRYKTPEEFRPFYEEYEVYLQEHPELLKYVPSHSNIDMENFLNLVLQKIDLNLEMKAFLQKAIYYVVKLFERATSHEHDGEAKEILRRLQLQSKDIQIIPNKFEEKKDGQKEIKVLQSLLGRAAGILGSI